ncbi:hypothetical protein ACIG5E_34325, partial [Kitasatospora sp. NPDC053057]|uniref:hypothetical protein n=1 Tax=Kitasatospora sp. NPDC053057 TaxID=3364062 RepID=UPI0037C9AC6D
MGRPCLDLGKSRPQCPAHPRLESAAGLGELLLCLLGGGLVLGDSGRRLLLDPRELGPVGLGLVLRLPTGLGELLLCLLGGGLVLGDSGRRLLLDPRELGP